MLSEMATIFTILYARRGSRRFSFQKRRTKRNEKKDTEQVGACGAVFLSVPYLGE